jgi:MFS family permease
LRRRALAGLVAAELISALGSQLTRLALPWFVLVETGSPARMALVFAAQLLPVALLGLPSGALVQRIGARGTMIGADLGRAPLIALVPLLHGLDRLSFPLLLLIAVALGAFATPYYASQRLVLPEVLGEDERVVARANSLIEGTTETTNLLGPALAGLLITLVGAENVLWLDAGSYLLSALTLLLLVPVSSQTPGEEHARGLLTGLRFLLSDELLRPVVFSTFAFGFAGPMLLAAIPYLAFARYDEDPTIAGWLLASWGAGAIAGSALAFRLAARLPPLQIASIGVVGFVTPLWFLAIELPAWGVAALLCLSGLANPLTNTVVAVLTVRVPLALRAKAMTTLITINRLIGPLGYVLAGLLLRDVGITYVFLLVAAVDSIAAGVFLSAALRRRGGEEPSCSGRHPRTRHS